MLESLLPYYERELAFLRKSGARFAQIYPEVAGQLQLSDGEVGEPHIERLIEAVALMTARVQRRLDLEFPEVTEALLANIHPHLVRCVPARGVAQLEADFAALSGAPPLRVPARSRLRSAPVSSGQEAEAVACDFRTVSPVEIWPVELSGAAVKPLINTPIYGRHAEGSVALELELTGTHDHLLPLPGMDRLRVHLAGEGTVSGLLYDLLFKGTEPQPANVWVEVDGRAVRLPEITLHTCGFEEDESYLDFDPRTLPAHRLLFEYFTFPEKFAFFELRGLRHLPATLGKRVRLYVVRPLELDSIEAETLMEGVEPRLFRLFCTPIVNLVERTAEPIRLDHRTHRYPVVPDIRRPNSYEVHAITGVELQRRGARIERQSVPPLFAAFHEGNGIAHFAWQAVRSEAEDGGHVVSLQLIARDLDPEASTSDRLNVRILASNRNLPTLLRAGLETGDLEMPAAPGPISRIRFVRRPRRPIRSPIGTTAAWRMISLLSLNYVSLSDTSAESLRQLLKVYNLADRRRDRLLFEEISRQIDGVVGAGGTTAYGRIGPGWLPSLAQGVTIDLRLDPSTFGTASRVLFGEVMAEFFALYAAVNSFTHTRLWVGDEEVPLKDWRPRAGVRPVT